MSASRPSRAIAGLLVGIVLLLLFTVATVAACGGGASFEGTWIQPGADGAMVITKAGDGYEVTIKSKESDATGTKFPATMNGDALELKDPTGAGTEVVSLTVSGDKLTMRSGDQTETLERK